MLPPTGWDRVRRQNDKFGAGIHAIFGIKDNIAKLQAIRFDKNKFTPAEAKGWCKDHNYKPILFEPATEGKEGGEKNMKKFFVCPACEYVTVFGDDSVCPKCEVEMEETENLTEEQISKLAEKQNKSKESKKVVLDKLPETKELKDVEIFKVGKWNNDSYSAKDLDEMVKAFNELKDEIKPPLKLGHGKQDLLKQQGMPAAGWISKLKIVGQKLLADIIQVPKTIYELVKKGAYKKISSEIYWGYKANDGHTYPRVLRAVALLGSDIPAVTGLKDVEALYKEEGRDIRIATFNMEEEKGGEEMEKVKELEEAIIGKDKEIFDKDKQLKENEAKIKENEEKVKKLEQEGTQLKTEKNVAETEKRNAEISSFIETNVKEGKILPRFSDTIKLLLENSTDEKTIKFSEEGKEKEKSPAELVKDLVTSMPNLVQFEEITKTKEKVKASKIETKLDEDRVIDGEELANKATEYAEKNKVSYEVALVEVSREEKRGK